MMHRPRGVSMLAYLDSAVRCGARRPAMSRMLASCVLLAASLQASAVGGPDPNAKGIKQMPTEKLIAELESTDARARLAATSELFRRGKMGLPALKKLGARQVAPVGGTIDNTRRLDMVYSILEEFPPNAAKAFAGYSLNSFGATFVKGATETDS